MCVHLADVCVVMSGGRVVSQHTLCTDGEVARDAEEAEVLRAVLQRERVDEKTNESPTWRHLHA